MAVLTPGHPLLRGLSIDALNTLDINRHEWGERFVSTEQVAQSGGDDMSTKVEMTYRTDAMSHSLAFSTTIMITRESIENLPVAHPFRTVGPEGIVDRLADDNESLPDRLRLLANMYETLYGHDRVLTTGTVVDMAIRSGVTPAEFVRRWHKQAIANLPPAKVRLRALDLGDG